MSETSKCQVLFLIASRHGFSSTNIPICFVTSVRAAAV